MVRWAAGLEYVAASSRDPVSKQDRRGDQGSLTSTYFYVCDVVSACQFARTHAHASHTQNENEEDPLIKFFSQTGTLRVQVAQGDLGFLLLLVLPSAGVRE